MNQNISAESAGDHQLLAVSPSERDHRQGSLNAQVVLIEYGDYLSMGIINVRKVEKFIP